MDLNHIYHVDEQSQSTTMSFFLQLDTQKLQSVALNVWLVLVCDPPVRLF